ncbi:YoaK family protein [Pantoea sp.]|uniref:YoaK family protein n=1 Tax=Pantoea sp. TaxID=69393 RepID=UPI00289D2B06|nr:YoaK family protein [Pantoea sp.]
MLIKKKKIRTHTEDRYLALALATTAGVLNAMAFGAFGFFPSHMSGNASQFSTEVSSSDLHDLQLLAVLIVAFIIGSMTSRLVVAAGLKRNIRTIFCLILLVEGAALTLTSTFEKMFYSKDNNGEILVMLGFLMGIHNSTSTQLSNGRIRSTHVTGTLTDAGIALGSFLHASFSRSEAADKFTHRKVLYTHLTTIFSFLTGCIAGFLLYKTFAFNAMIGLGLILVVIALWGVMATLRTAGRRPG